MHKKQRGKQHKKIQQDKEVVDTNTIHSPIKIKILLAYLEKLLYLCKSFCKKNEKNLLCHAVFSI